VIFFSWYQPCDCRCSWKCRSVMATDPGVISRRLFFLLNLTWIVCGQWHAMMAVIWSYFWLCFLCILRSCVNTCQVTLPFLYGNVIGLTLILCVAKSTGLHKGNFNQNRRAQLCVIRTFKNEGGACVFLLKGRGYVRALGKKN
jgi:hypothetical protein